MVEKETKELVLAREDKGEVAGYIKLAIEKGLPVETMERLFALHKEVKADNAKEAFVTAMANFQKRVKTIKKTKSVFGKDGKVRYQYAPIDSIVEQVKEPLSDNGMSYSWESTSKEKMMMVVCKVTHIQGHTEQSSFEIPIGSEYMTMPQQYAAALSFARRYTLCNVLGISTADEDTDATTVDKEQDAKSVKARIVFLLKALGEKNSTKAECEVAVKKLTQLDLTEKNYGEVVERLEFIKDERQNNEDSKVR